MFTSSAELRKYVSENYPEVSDYRFNSDHWDIECTTCKLTRGFQVTARSVGNEQVGYSSYKRDYDSPVTYLFRCPVCHAFKQWIVYEWQIPNAEGKFKWMRYRLSSVPSEGLEDIGELPENPPSLRESYCQAIRAKDANANIAAAAMFRRAVQVITRNILGSKPGNLANELNEAVGKTYNGTTITARFADNGYIVKEAGNQGAHPDKDPDLLDFTSQDAEDLQSIFMELVSELFIAPAAVKKAKDEFMARRKVMLPIPKKT